WQLARVRAYGRPDVALVQILGEFESDVAAQLPPERGAEDQKRAQLRPPGAARARREGRLRGTICAWPTPEWASRVFPGLDEKRAQRRLARDLLSFCRVGPDTPRGHAGGAAPPASAPRP